MNCKLAAKLHKIGVDSSLEFRSSHRNATRSDGWSAIGTYQQEVSVRRLVLEEIESMGLFPEKLSNSYWLDFGSGIGATAMAIAPRAELAVCLDATFEHCVSAIEGIEHAGLDNVAVLLGSVLSCPQFPTVPFRANSFDAIISYHGFWRQDFLKLIPDWSGMVKSGGCIYLIYPRFWLSTSGLNDDEQQLLKYSTEHATNWSNINYGSIQAMADMCSLRIAQRAPLQSVPYETMTGIVFLSSGIVRDKHGYVELMGDFSLRWRCRNELLILKRI